MKVNFYGIEPYSLLEWPGHQSIVIFFNGCQLRCAYCHNYHLLDAVNMVDVEHIEEQANIILNRQHWRPKSLQIDAMVFSGGEASDQPDALFSLLTFAKSHGLKTMVETNGYNPDTLYFLSDLIDELYVDIKTTKDIYPYLTHQPDAWDRLQKTLDLPMKITTRSTIFHDIPLPDRVDHFNRGLNDLTKSRTFHEYKAEEFEAMVNATIQAQSINTKKDN